MFWQQPPVGGGYSPDTGRVRSTTSAATSRSSRSRVPTKQAASWAAPVSAVRCEQGRSHCRVTGRWRGPASSVAAPREHHELAQAGAQRERGQNGREGRAGVRAAGPGFNGGRGRLARGSGERSGVRGEEQSQRSTEQGPVAHAVSAPSPAASQSGARRAPEPVRRSVLGARRTPRVIDSSMART
jgi:hypothetical protein